MNLRCRSGKTGKLFCFTHMGQFISIITFPGIIIHEFSHEFFCHVVGVRVRKVRYFRFGNPAGYVIHDQSQYFFQAFFIAVGPFILGTLLALVSFLISDRTGLSVKKLAWLWFGVSIAMNCFPSRGDAKNLWQENWEHFKHNIFAIFGLPFTALVWIVSLLDSVWFSILYAGFMFYLVGILV